MVPNTVESCGEPLTAMVRSPPGTGSTRRQLGNTRGTQSQGLHPSDALWSQDLPQGSANRPPAPPTLADSWDHKAKVRWLPKQQLSPFGKYWRERVVWPSIAPQLPDTGAGSDQCLFSSIECKSLALLSFKSCFAI